MESWLYYVWSLIMGNGYVNLLWKLLLIDNIQGKQIIYYIKNIENTINIKMNHLQEIMENQFTTN